MTNGDGNGWVRCGRGHRHWGRHGAAGLLIAAPDEAGRQTVLLQQRSWWGRYGGAWGPPGGARDSHESVVRAALREAIEECAIDPRPVRVHGVITDDHGGWTYQTVLASTAAQLAAAAASEESSEVAWVPVAEVERLRLHPGFAGQWRALRAALSPLTVIVDAANVMGSRPDGWWRDRAGAARRLCDQIEGLAMDGVTGVPDSVQVPALERWFPHFVVVLEGAAAGGAGAGQDSTDRQVRIVLASGSGDDEIVRQATETIRQARETVRQAGETARQAAESAGPCLVVTADRELRARCQAVGAATVGPRWLLDLL